MVANSGRLELTWTNKHLTLLSGEDGAYEWVEPTDVRVAETRLLDEVAAVGEVGPQSRAAADNLLIQGDSLQALRSLQRLPDFARHYAGRVKLIYIDPPFNTGQAFANYDDALEHSVWLTMMRDRLVELKRLLAPDGTIWVHLDDAEVHRMRCLLDEIFGPSSFLASVIWEKADAVLNNNTRFSPNHDILTVYGDPAWRANRLPRTEEMNEIYKNHDDDPRGRWFAGPFTVPGVRKNQQYPITNPAGETFTPPRGRSWYATEPVFEELLADGRIHFPKDGAGKPHLKLFLTEAKGRTVSTLWPVKEVLGNRQAKQHIIRLFPDQDPFATPKPEQLLERIIHVTTSPGDIVLDCFVGSGTTAAVAQKMGRRWVAIERAPETVDGFTRPRLEKVIKGEDPGGITEAVGWEGGGGFRLVEVGESMYELDEDGEVFLSPSVTNGRFAEAVRAQLSFAVEDDPPFCGRKGRARLAVMDGVVGEVEARHLVAALGEGERLVLVAKAVDDDVEPLLAELSPGSRIRKAPRDLVRSVGRIVR